MSRLLLTQSLISSWQYIFDCTEGYESDALEDFIKALKREPRGTSPAMADGIEFENEVYKTADKLERKVHPKWENGIQTVAKRLVGAQFQVKCRRELSVGGFDFLVYGIMDAIKAGHIFDVKYMQKSFGSVEVAGKYLNSPQHPAYLYCVPEALDFTYLLSDGEDVYEERYTREISRPFPEIALEFVNSISDMGLLEIYKDKWISK